MTVCLPLTPDGHIGPLWARARRVAVAQVEGDAITDWKEVEVGWDLLPELGVGAGQRTRIARFVREQGVQVVLAPRMSSDIQALLSKMGVRVRLGVRGDAHAVAATAGPESVPRATVTGKGA